MGVERLSSPRFTSHCYVAVPPTPARAAALGTIHACSLMNAVKLEPEVPVPAR
jgi:hypothetical protein